MSQPNRFWWKLPLLCAVLGAVIGYSAGILMAKLPTTASLPITVVVVVWLWFWALATVRELRVKKQIIDEQMKILEDIMERRRV